MPVGSPGVDALVASAKGDGRRETVSGTALGAVRAVSPGGDGGGDAIQCMIQCTAEQAVAFWKARLELMQANAEEVAKVKANEDAVPKDHLLLLDSIGFNKRVVELRSQFGFDGAPPGSFRKAIAQHDSNSSVNAVQKEIFSLLPPVSGGAEHDLYRRLVLGEWTCSPDDATQFWQLRLESLQANAEAVEKMKSNEDASPRDHAVLLDSIGFNKKVLAMRKEIGFDGAPPGSMRKALAEHNALPSVCKLMKDNFDLLAPVHGTPEYSIYGKLCLGWTDEEAEMGEEYEPMYDEDDADTGGQSPRGVMRPEDSPMSAAQVVEFFTANLKLLQENPELVEQLKELDYHGRNKLISQKTDWNKQVAGMRDSFGFKGWAPGSMRRAMKPHMEENADVHAVMKQIFGLLPPPDNAPEEVALFKKLSE